MRTTKVAIVVLMLGCAASAAIGQCGFGDFVTHDVGNRPESVAVGDLDGDGDPDLAVANSGGDNVSVLLNQCPPPCTSDLSGDGSVGPPDLAVLLTNWGPCPAPCAPDLNGDGVVGPPDLATLLTNWGPCP